MLRTFVRSDPGYQDEPPILAHLVGQTEQDWLIEPISTNDDIDRRRDGTFPVLHLSRAKYKLATDPR